MAWFRFRSLVLVALLLLMAGRTALAAETISLTVDATRTQRKILHAHLVMPVKAGPLTLYYPKWIPSENGPDGPIANLSGLKFEGNERQSHGSATCSMPSLSTWKSPTALGSSMRTMTTWNPMATRQRTS